MADAFLSFALRKLGDFLSQQVSLLISLRDKIKWLRNELLFIQPFLKDAELKQCGDQRVVQWVFEINSIANDAVAILETYTFEAAELLKAEPRRSILSIYGMGGLGKTTLARKLYISPNIASSFLTHAWICVSQEYNTMDLLRNIIKSIHDRTKETLDLLERMTEGDLKIYLRDLLKERKYLVVADDVWQKEAWESLKRAFPDSKNGSKVIITTRKEDVAKRADDRGFAHKLRFLSQEESWDLFRRKLLDVRAMVPKMESLAKDMVEKCRGLPLAIVVLSRLLSHKKGLNEWQKVKDHLWKNIKEDKSIEISNILSLSYNDLSVALKQCLLYFGIFPEDQVLEADNIIRLWMAKGFIPRGEEIMEDTTEGFLNELIRRNLVQVAKTFWERVTECKVHDLLHDLAIQKALEVNFFDIYDPKSHYISSLCIRHVIHSQGERYPSLDLSNLKLRSLMSFDPDFRKMSLINFRSVFQHLYVLYLEMRVDNMSIFLSLRGIDDLPSSIGNLKNLQTLVVNEGGYTCQLPRETTDLINLRHLVARYSKPLVHISKLTSLQVVDGIHCDQWKDVDPVDLVNLGELSMHHIKKSYSLNNISSLKNLSILTLLCEGYKTFPSLEFVNCCEKLLKLRLKGVIEKLPNLFPNSITMMVLRDSRLTEDPMPILGMLPNLRNLKLITAYEGKEMMCRDNSFSQLDFLILNDLYNLERWHLATNSMPLIKGFAIYDCPNLKKIPERMKDWKDINPVDLVNLRELSMHHINKSYSLNNISRLKNLSTLRLFCEGYKSFPSLEFVNCYEKLQKLWLEGRIEKLHNLFANSITMVVLRDSRLTQDPMPILGILENLERWHLATTVMPLIKGLRIQDCRKRKEITERIK
ncbi:hypothetical protein H5410_021160 [Solanum commersonii]|uniref:NB-ARC domain-containing protein n=1 Tax=Solanum commersonii TaxID=4109 RepID=A0A9J5ZD69_SOLCO|nr:hypothetical protein H5410_021160 [Solanum commersonii]